MQSSTIEFNQPEFQISVEKLASLSEMEERIMAYFTTEGIELQHVSEFLKDQNLGAFKGMGKLSSPMKLDITKSPLRRHRANTICLWMMDALIGGWFHVLVLLIAGNTYK